MEKGRTTSKGSASPFVHQDSFKTPLRHPKTGEMVDSQTRWNQINKEHGLRVVGNDWINDEPKNEVRDRITDEKVIDACDRALAIETDPDKRRQKRYQEQVELENFMRRRGDSYEVIKHAREIQEMMHSRK